MRRAKLACLIVLALMLASCQISDDASVLPGVTTSAPTPTANSVAPSSQATEASLPSTTTTLPPAVEIAPTRRLLIYTVEDGPSLERLQRLADTFTGQSGWSTELIHKDATTICRDLVTAALAEQAPDLLWAGNDAIAPCVSMDAIQPVDDFVRAADFVPAAVGAAQLNGALWGVPVMAGNQLVLLFNRRLLPVAPDTTDALLKLGKPAGADVLLAYNQAGPLWVTPWLGGFGGRIVGDDGKPTLNTPEMVRTLGFLKELRDKDIAPDSDFATSEAQFKDGKVAMIIDGDWMIGGFSGGEAAGMPNLDLGVAPLPVVSATNRPAAALASGTYLLVPKGLASSRLAAVRRLVTFLTGADNQVRFGTEWRRLPALQAALQAPQIQSDPELQARAAALTRGAPMPAQAGLQPIWDAIQARMGAAIVGEQSPEEAAQDMQAAASGQSP